MSACSSFGALLIPLSLLHPCAFVCMCSWSICEKMCCLSLSQVSLVNEMPDSRGTNLDKWSPRTGHKACNVPASAESSPGQKHNTWFWTLCSLCLNKAWLKHVFFCFVFKSNKMMNEQRGADRRWLWIAAETEEEMDKSMWGQGPCLRVCVCVFCSLESTLEIAWEKDL